MNIGKIIKEERLARGLTQEQLANEFFVTRQLISKWENEKSYPDLTQVVKLSDYFELPLDYLLKEDQAMVTELNLDSRKKRWGKWLIGILSVLSIILLTVLALGFWIDPVNLTKEDITITGIKKYRLPETTITNKATGQTIRLPEDVEYLISFTTNKPLIRLPKIAGYKNYSNEKQSLLLVEGHHELEWGPQESAIIVRSSREENLTDPQLNFGKNLYLYNMKKAGAAYKKDPSAVNRVSIPAEGDLLFTTEELEALPFEKGTLSY
ncbi:helix-turn-helix transcriptional regulator [Enterococcus sp.]|uniref:helix-turn-helix domain-containing protein n=1 Tax=Enterococcus sp. TaxID=35783 RepID=UPI0025C6E4CF|nr:helix-turn-helix transcriptional regulator [Enterococcus sp.]